VSVQAVKLVPLWRDRAALRTIFGRPLKRFTVKICGSLNAEIIEKKARIEGHIF
jgi:hypothetical protein